MAGESLVQERSTFRESFVCSKHGRTLLVLDLDQIDCFVGNLQSIGSDDCDRFAH
jgi:hypothetical protein